MTKGNRQLGKEAGRGEAWPTGRLRVEGVTDADRNYAIAMHISVLLAAAVPPLIVAPLVVWLVRRNASVFDDDHGREVLNLLLSAMILWTVFAIGGILTLGLAWAAVLIWTVVEVIGVIRGAVAAGNGEYFRYPMIFRFL